MSRFITVFTAARQWSVTWTRKIESTCIHNSFLKISLNCLLPCWHRSSKWALTFRYSVQDVCISVLLCLHNPSPSHPPWFRYRNDIWVIIQMIKTSCHSPYAAVTSRGPICNFWACFQKPSPSKKGQVSCKTRKVLGKTTFASTNVSSKEEPNPYQRGGAIRGDRLSARQLRDCNIPGTAHA